MGSNAHQQRAASTAGASDMDVRDKKAYARHEAACPARRARRWPVRFMDGAAAATALSLADVLAEPPHTIEGRMFKLGAWALIWAIAACWSRWVSAAPAAESSK